MVRRYDAQIMCDTMLRKHGLWDKGWRTNFTKSDAYIGLCYHSDKRIVLSIQHLNARSEPELMDTILHEIAHALVGPQGNSHNHIWKEKAIELGAKPQACAHSNVDAGRALNPVEVRAASKIKSINSLCPICHKVAEEEHRAKMGDTVFIKLKCGHLISKDTIKNVFDEIDNWSNLAGTKKLYPYQVDGIKFIAKSNGRCLIADEPGLGKTIQALAALKFYPEMRPALWVCKSTLTIQTLREALEWAGIDLAAQIIEHSKYFILPGFNLYIISMDLLRRMPTEKMDEIKFKTVIVDEVQHFKDTDSIRTAELRTLVARAEFFIALSGTPWKNRGSEYFPVLNMINPEMFPSPKHFRFNWVEDYYDKQTGKYREGGIKDIPYFRQVTKDFIIRRMRDDVLPDLPKINRTIRFVDMDEEFSKVYDKEESAVAAMLKAAIIDGKPPKMLAAMIMQLKHITGRAKVSTCLDDLKEWLENVEDDFEKITIFHHHIDVGDSLQDGVKNSKGKLEVEGIDKWLTDRGYEPSLRLYGGRGVEEREAIINKFKTNPKCRVMIASTLASGEGLNIQFCQHARMLERQWNPQNEEQAELRFSRPLTKEDLPDYLKVIAERQVSIEIPYLIAVGTVDEILTNIVERKRHNYRKSMNEKDIDLRWEENDIIKEVAEEIIRKRYKKTK